MNSIIRPSEKELRALLDPAIFSAPEEDLPRIFREFNIPEGTDFLQIHVPQEFTTDNVCDKKMVMCTQTHDFGTMVSPRSHPQLFEF